MKDSNDFIESSLTVRDVPNTAPAEIQIRRRNSAPPFKESCNLMPPWSHNFKNTCAHFTSIKKAEQSLIRMTEIFMEKKKSKTRIKTD